MPACFVSLPVKASLCLSRCTSSLQRNYAFIRPASGGGSGGGETFFLAFFHFKRSSKASVFSSFSFSLFVSISTSTFGIRERRKKTRLKLNYGLCVAVVQRRREVTWLPRQEKPTYMHIYRHIYISIYLDNVLYIHTPNTTPACCLGLSTRSCIHIFFVFSVKNNKKRSTQLSGRIIHHRGRTGWCVDLY